MAHRARDAGWLKSSRSGGNGENCVEVRVTDMTVGVRDSKNPTGSAFVFDGTRWRSFLAEAKSGRFDA